MTYTDLNMVIDNRVLRKIFRPNCGNQEFAEAKKQTSS
jgi:hypothetical protein